jgi:radical SAM protein with 4Fe4S-binding SPASM domain
MAFVVFFGERPIVSLLRIATGPADLQKTAEYQEVIRPLLAEIERVYARMIFRAPTDEEVARHVTSFFQQFPRFRERRQAIRTGDIRRHLGIRPLSLEMDVTNQCNIRCIMCYFSIPQLSKRKREDLSLEAFARIAEQVFPFCASVSLSNICEPLLHPQLGEMLAITKRWGVPRVSFTTNGLLFNEPTIEDVVVHGIDEVCISIDAATKPTYERIRRKGNFDRLMANLGALRRAKQRHRSPAPVIGLSFVLMRSNIAELPAFVKLARDVGASYVKANHLLQAKELDLHAEALETDPELCNRFLDESRALAEKYQITIALPESFQPPSRVAASHEPEPAPDGFATPVGLEQALVTASDEPAPAPDSSSRLSLPVLSEAPSPSPVSASESCSRSERERRDERLWSYFGIQPWGNEDHRSCLFPWHFVNLNPSGWLLPCGSLGEALGNIHQESFEEIWNNARFQALRAEHTNGNLRAACQRCPASTMGNVNQPSSFGPREFVERDPQGCLDLVDSDLIHGWARDNNWPDTPVQVDIYVDGRLLATVTADEFRPNLLEAGIGKGKHAFSYPTPAHLKDGQIHTIRVLMTEGTTELPGSPKEVRFPSTQVD